MAQQCPFCNHELHILPDMAGKKVVCALCHQEFIASPSISHSEKISAETSISVSASPAYTPAVSQNSTSFRKCTPGQKAKRTDKAVPKIAAKPSAETDETDGALARRYNTCGYGAGTAGFLCAAFEGPPILALLCWIGCLIFSILALRNMSDYQRSESFFGRTVKGTSCCNTLISIVVLIAYLFS